MAERFSRRIGPFRNDPEISVRDDAPQHLRRAVVALAESYNIDASSLGRRLIRLLKVPRVVLFGHQFMPKYEDIRQVIDKCDWSNVYDIIEELYEELVLTAETRYVPIKFTEEINDHLRQHGIAYQLVDGQVEHRGDDSFESSAKEALRVTQESGLDAAQRELSEALDDLSKRPQPDLTGAITHSINALEAVAGEVSGDRSATMGKIVNDNPDMFPKPLDVAVEKMWGYASQYGRHVSEDKDPTQDEAELVVHVSAAAVTYLVRKAGLTDGDTP